MRLFGERNEMAITVVFLFIVSLVVSTWLARWSNRRVLGVDPGWVKQGGLVLARTGAATIAGFALGKVISLGMQGQAVGLVEAVQYAGLGLAGVASFLLYWLLLGRVANKPIPFLGMLKAVTLESVAAWTLIVLGAFAVSALVVGLA